MNPFKHPYDGEWALALYACYESGDDSVLTELLESLCPLIRKCYLLEIGEPTQNQDFLEADAFQEIYRIISAKSVPYDHPRVFTRYLATCINRQMRDSIKESYQKPFDFWKVCHGPVNLNNLPGHWETEQRIYQEQILVAVKEFVISKIRFYGTEAEACKFILECELGSRNVDPRIARRKYGLTGHRCRYLIQYVKVLVRAAAWELRERECEGGSLTSIWQTSGSILCATG